AALAVTFAVYLPDRRGGGTGGPDPEHCGSWSDVEDMAAQLAKTVARVVFGVSSGAIIWLHAALALGAIQRAAIFEPPLMTDATASSPLLRRFDDEIAHGNVAAALVTGMKAARLRPPIFDLIPRWLLEPPT